MLLQRVISGLVMGALAIAVIVAGGIWFILGSLAIFAMASFEFAHLTARRGERVFTGLLLLWLALFWADALFPDAELLNPGITLLLLMSMGWAVVRFQQGTTNATSGFAMTVAGAFYIGWIAAHFVKLRFSENGLFWTLTIVLTVWASDTGAYFVGRWIGRTLLIPSVSPGKTWEGYLGGIVAGTLAAFLLSLLWSSAGANAATPPRHSLILGLLISSASPLGDLSISILKRYAQVKDSSHLIPGHGGFLDRIDSLLWAVALGYYYLRFSLF